VHQLDLVRQPPELGAEVGDRVVKMAVGEEGRLLVPLLDPHIESWIPGWVTAKSQVGS
jgi:hypothetical protein